MKRRMAATRAWMVRGGVGSARSLREWLSPAWQSGRVAVRHLFVSRWPFGGRFRVGKPSQVSVVRAMLPLQGTRSRPSKGSH